MQKKPSWHRTDIDGLRALAIIPVIFFHLGVSGFGGGFVGVDIFFVISGFLITHLIYRELAEGRFSFWQFFERRLRRIVPAATVMTVGTLLAGYFIIIFPIDYADLGQSVFAHAMLLANVFFFRKDDYFAESAETMPLLHTWSLSIEEQFYIFFPVLLYILYRLAKRWLMGALVLLGTLSLALAWYWGVAVPHESFSLPGIPNLWGGASNLEAGFYLLPTRVFEFVIGGVIAIGGWQIRRRYLAEVAAVIGVGLMLYAIVGFDMSTPFPGVAALVPTLGAALVILANTKTMTFTGRVLCFPVMVAIGLLSYSLYLWHWPILVLGQQYFDRTQFTPLEVLGYLILSFVVAIASYYLVEQPFRKKQIASGRWQMYGTGILLIMMSGGAGAYIAAKDGLPGRAAPEAQAIAAATLDFGPRRDECFVNSFAWSDEPCRLGVRDETRIDFVLWGDSHGAALLPMLDQSAAASDVSGASFLAPGCQPGRAGLPGVDQRCQDIEELMYAFLEKHTVATILLIGRWPTVDSPTTDQWQDTFSDHINRLRAAGVVVYLVEQVPAHPYFSVRDYFIAAHYGSINTQPNNIALSEHASNTAATRGLFTTLATDPEVHIITPSTGLCDTDTGNCSLYHNGTLIYQDGDHLNQTGAFTLTSLFTEEFFNKLK